MEGANMAAEVSGKANMEFSDFATSSSYFDMAAAPGPFILGLSRFLLLFDEDEDPSLCRDVEDCEEVEEAGDALRLGGGDRGVDPAAAEGSDLLVLVCECLS